jgi:predicted phosphodiesterase
MRKIIFFFSLLACSTAWSQQVTHSEFLGRVSDHACTVQLFFDADAEVAVQYGSTSGQYDFQTTWQVFPEGEPAEIVMDSLQANSTWFYRVKYRTPGTTAVTLRDEHSFRTAKPAQSPFTFVVQADPHMDEQSDTAIYERCLLNQLADNPDFIIDMGDVVMTDKLKNANNVITEDTIHWRSEFMRSYYEAISHSIPMYMVLGNHEGETGWNLDGTADNFAVWSTNLRKKYFVNPQPNDFFTGDETDYEFVGRREDYYAWHWGDALFMVLDPYWHTEVKPDSTHGWRWTLGETQYNWMKNTLESSQATYKFVFCHQLVGGDPDGRGGIEYSDLYEWGGHNLDGTPGFADNRPGWYAPIKQILMENEVTIFFHGHDHFFAKQERDCLIYQECPQPSHPNFSNANSADDYGYVEGLILPNSGHLRINVDPSGVNVEYVRVYKPEDENNTRHNGDISATYFIPAGNCYDTLQSGIPMIWNSDYLNELVYPNPFTESVHIAFSMAKSESVSIEIFNEQGQHVRHLVRDTPVAQGRFTVMWDGRDDQGIELTNGVYHYTVSARNRNLNSGRIVLQK